MLVMDKARPFNQLPYFFPHVDLASRYGDRIVGKESDGNWITVAAVAARDSSKVVATKIKSAQRCPERAGSFVVS